MRIFALDPGLHHLMWTITEWAPGEDHPQLLTVLEVGELETPMKERKKGLDAVLDTVDRIQAYRWVDLPRAECAVVEAQHFKARAVRSEDIRNLAMVTGAAACCLPYEVEFAPTGPGGWSCSKKEMRHKRIRQYYCPKFDFDQAFADFGKRKTGDLMDTVGMAFWKAWGKPRSGI